MRTFIPTCESAVCTVPEWHRADFKDHQDLVTSSKGWSPGALNLAQGIASRLHAPLLHAEMSRLIVDLSRHPEDDARWSHISKTFTEDQRQRLDDRQKTQYLGQLDQRISDAIGRGEEVIHISVDTVPDPGGACIVFTYDTRSPSEAEWVAEWSSAIRSGMPDVYIRNDAAPGHDLASYLREKFPAGFSSVRITVDQRCFLEGTPVKWTPLKKAISHNVPR